MCSNADDREESCTCENKADAAVSVEEATRQFQIAVQHDYELSRGVGSEGWWI